MARKIPREFVPLDLNLPRNPAIRHAGPDAELLFVRGLIYLKSTGKDGVIPEFDLDVVAAGLRNVKRSAEILVAQGLWARCPGGWEVPSWLSWNKSQAEIAEDKEAKRQAAILTNHRRFHKAEASPDCPHCKEKEAA